MPADPNPKLTAAREALAITQAPRCGKLFRPDPRYTDADPCGLVRGHGGRCDHGRTPDLSVHLATAFAEIDRLAAEADDYVAVCPYCMDRVSACDEERCCATCGTDLVVCTDDHGAEMLLLALKEAAAGDVTKWMVGCENKRIERIRLDDEITAARLIATGSVSAEHAQDIVGLVGEVARLRTERDRLTADLATLRAGPAIVVTQGVGFTEERIKREAAERRLDEMTDYACAALAAGYALRNADGLVLPKLPKENA